MKPSTTLSLEQKIARCLDEASPYFITQGASHPILVAYSGGSDSCALLVAAVAEAGRRAIPVRALYVDHGLRDDIERLNEKSLVTSTCRALGVPLSIATVPQGRIAGLAGERHCGVEAAARSYRRVAMRRCMERFGASVVLTGHTLDDHLETLLMRVFRGAGARGLRGIDAVSALPPRGFILRPLLSASKRDLVTYLERKGFPYSTDSTNASGIYLRNRVRNTLIPTLDSTIPGWRRALLLTSEKAAVDEEAFQAFLHPQAKPGIRGRHENLPVEASLPQPPQALRIRSILAAAAAKCHSPPLSWRAARSIDESFVKGAHSCVARGLRFTLREGSIIVAPALDFPRPGGYFLIFETEGEIHCGGLQCSAFWQPEGKGRGPLEGSFSFPLVLRTRLPGDRLVTESGSIRLDDLLASWKLDRSYRSSVPLIEDSQGIVAVLGGFFGAPDRFRPFSRGGCGRILALDIKGVGIRDGL